MKRREQQLRLTIETKAVIETMSKSDVVTTKQLLVVFEELFDRIQEIEDNNRQMQEMLANKLDKYLCSMDFDRYPHRDQPILVLVKETIEFP